MVRSLGLLSLLYILAGSVLYAQPTVCDLFEDLPRAAGPHNVSVRGELFLNGSVSALAATDCENKFAPDHVVWPTIINLRASAALKESKRRAIESAAARIQQMRVNC
jgi:hypothetical protein